MGRKVKCKVCVAYRVWDYIDVIIDEDTDERDALEHAERISYDRSLNDMCCDHDLTEVIEREYVEDNVFVTPGGLVVEVSFVPDVGDNVGGYYCEIYNEYLSERIDDFVIHKEDIVGLEGDELQDKLRELTKEYINGVDTY